MTKANSTEGKKRDVGKGGGFVPPKPPKPPPKDPPKPPPKPKPEK